MTIVYKVVRRTEDPEVFTSALMELDISMKYRLGVKTRNKGFMSCRGYYPLAYRTLAEAADFQKSVRPQLHRESPCIPMAILKCEAELAEEMPTWMFCVLNGATSEYSFTFSYNLHAQQQIVNCWPEGTVMCKKLIPLEEV